MKKLLKTTRGEIVFCLMWSLPVSVIAVTLAKYVKVDHAFVYVWFGWAILGAIVLTFLKRRE